MAMIKLLNLVKQIPKEWIAFIFAMTVFAIVVVIDQIWRDTKLVNYVVDATIILVPTLLVYAGNFADIKPLRFGILLSLVVAIVTVVIVLFVWQFIEVEERRFYYSIGFIIQLALGRLLRHILKLDNKKV